MGAVGSPAVTPSWSGDAYRDRRVLVTGHTGFKGSWLALWLCHLGADVTGFALEPPTEPNLFTAANVGERIRDERGDIRILGELERVWAAVRPDMVFHLAAQSIVRRSYEEPVETVSTNVLGTTHVLELARLSSQPVSVVLITSDKCYENVEWVYGYRETDALGGRDVYSGSKAAAEAVIHSYRRSFGSPERFRVASARAGNVIGGGDWSVDRIVPDCIRALAHGQGIVVRHPYATRPWQHVLEPLSGYLTLGARLLQSEGDAIRAAGAWNFGPDASESSRTVRELVQRVIALWGSGERSLADDVASSRTEATLLRLCIDKAQTLLGWSPRWDFDTTVTRTVDWYRRFYDGEPADALCLEQITRYENPVP